MDNNNRFPPRGSNRSPNRRPAGLGGVAQIPYVPLQAWQQQQAAQPLPQIQPQQLRQQPAPAPAGQSRARAQPAVNAPAAEPPKKRSKIRRFFKVAAIGLTATAVASGAVGGPALVALNKINSELPDIHKLTEHKAPQTTKILARDGSQLAEIYTERRTNIKLDDLPAHVKLATLAAEDASFYEHEGISYTGIVRAGFKNLVSGHKKQGASTITQQVVKNILGDTEKTYTRKIKEIQLAIKLEQQVPPGAENLPPEQQKIAIKNWILENYFNENYYANGRYGIQEASKYYFDKDAKELTIAQAAFLAGIPNSPEKYNPIKDEAHFNAAIKRQHEIIDQMAEKGFLDKEPAQAKKMAESIKSEPIVITTPSEATSGPVSEVVGIVRERLTQVAGSSYKATGGYEVETTIDPRVQALARTAVRENLEALDKRMNLQVRKDVPTPYRNPGSVVAQSGKKGKHAVVASASPYNAEPPFEGMPTKSDFNHGVIGVVTAADDVAKTVEFRVGKLRGYMTMAQLKRYNPDDVPASQFAEVGAHMRVSLVGNPDKVLALQPGTNEPGRVQLSPAMGAESAMVVIDPATKEILALVGGYDGSNGGFDRATQAMRQAGSTLKPALYAQALELGLATPGTVCDPEAIKNKFAPGGIISMRGLKMSVIEDKNFREPVLLREALAQSLNPVATDLMAKVTPQRFVTWAHQLGIPEGVKMDLGLSLAQGAVDVNALIMANMFTTIFNGGVAEPSHLLTKMRNPDKTEIALPERPAPQRVMQANTAYLITDMLTSVVDHGTAKAAGKVFPARSIAGKTGTSNIVDDANVNTKGTKDAWFAGMKAGDPKDPQNHGFVGVVWVGMDDGSSLGKETGATAALPAWISLANGLQNNRSVTLFQPPPEVQVPIDPATGLPSWGAQTPPKDGIVKMTIDPATGLLPWAGQENLPKEGVELLNEEGKAIKGKDGKPKKALLPITESFLPGTEPKARAPVPTGLPPEYIPQPVLVGAAPVNAIPGYTPPGGAPPLLAPQPQAPLPPSSLPQQQPSTLQP
ncbi:MAG: transglycosylase domain-containing protein [Alphaproteobacteria bacterium]